MSRRIFLDVEEALSREVRRITFHDNRTQDKTVLQDTFDPFTGEVIQAPVEADFYDSSADANHIQYPHFFIRLMKTREDRFTGRVVPQYGKWITSPVATSPRAFAIILGSFGLIPAIGNNLTTTAFQINKIQPGYLLRLLNGNNKGTYKVSSVIVSPIGDHEIVVSNTIVENLPESLFVPVGRKVLFQAAVDLNTVKVGDVYTDATSTSFNITAVDAGAGTITIDGTGTPSLLAEATITRIGNVFTSTDLSLVQFVVMDPEQPIQTATGCDATGQSQGFSPAIPIDAYYMIRIDSKTRENHIDTLNRVWEEFNPPRTALAVIKRTALSAEQALTVDIPTGGSNIVTVKDNSKFSVGDPIFIFDDLIPTQGDSGESFERPFQSKVVEKISNNQLKLSNTVPDTFKYANCAKIVSHAEFQLLMFHFVDHVTKDVEGSQYWVHEFTFWVQIWVDRLEEAADVGVITEISTPIEDLEGNEIIEDI